MSTSLRDHGAWTKLGITIAGLYVGCKLGQILKRSLQKRRLYGKIKERQELCAETFEAIEEEVQQAKLSRETIERIVSLELSALIQEIQDDKVSITDVLHAYQIQALQVNKDTNAVTQFLPEACTIAESYDRENKKEGLLYGVPVSLKENFNLAGDYSTMGLACMLDNLTDTDAVLVKVLKAQGAIPFVRTNVPQTLMTYECSNPIFGRTNHPQDKTRVPGGSTGGEAAILAAGGSILGFGSDIGGSIRVPCHFCGVYGLKTTSERLSRKGGSSLSKGQTLVTGTVGPMARDLDGLVLSMRAILCDYHFQLDPQISPVKFRDEIYNSKRPLRVGFYVDNGYIPAVPACQRAVYMAKQALEAQGHTVVLFNPPRVAEAVSELFFKTVQGDGGRTFTEKLNQDIKDPCIEKLTFLKKFWKVFQLPLTYIIQAISKDPIMGKNLRCTFGIKTVYDWWLHAIKLQAYKDEWLEAWTNAGLDALICPVFGTIAVPHGKIPEIVAGCGSYAMLYNILNYPAGSLPVTRVIQADIDNLKDYPHKTWTQKVVIEVTKGSVGLPVGVQCVCLPFQEEQVLRVMKEVETGLVGVPSNM